MNECALTPLFTKLLKCTPRRGQYFKTKIITVNWDTLIVKKDP